MCGYRIYTNKFIWALKRRSPRSLYIQIAAIGLLWLQNISGAGTVVLAATFNLKYISIYLVINLLISLTHFSSSFVPIPAEVCRTRLRQNVSRAERRYHSFLQTLRMVWMEEGIRGLYGGMSAHLMRVVPNTAIVFFTYEAVVRLLDE